MPVCVPPLSGVSESGLSQPLVLPSSQEHDSVLCSAVADVNWDGRNELIIGTYGKVPPLQCGHASQLCVSL